MSPLIIVKALLRLCIFSLQELMIL